MSKEFVLFDNDELNFKMKFYRLMDLLVSNKSSSRMESVIFFGIFYIQMLAGFFDINVGVMQIEDSTSDNILNYLYRIVRVKGLFLDNYSAFQIAIYLITGLILLMTALFLFILLDLKKNTFYTYKEFLINFSIKIFLYIAFNVILDLTLANICFDTMNPNFPSQASCNVSNILVVFLISLFLVLYSIFLGFFINLFYHDSYFLSNSYYSRMNCGYEMYLILNCVIYSVLLIEAKYLGNEIFLIYNFIISLIFLKFYFDKYLYYDRVTNFIVGVFHLIYAWTSLFFLIFSFITMNEKGVIYLVGVIIVIFLFYNLKYKLEESIILKTPLHKIMNKYHLLFYFKNIIDKIHNLDTSAEAKAELVGIIQNHIVECPNRDCLAKRKETKIYLPVTEEWSHRDKPEIKDKVYLLTFIVTLMNYFISQSYFNAEMLINLSLYYLTIIGNQCQAIFYYRKVKEMKLTLQENFAFIRLNFAISNIIIEKLRPSNEGAPKLEDLNSTLYFKYEDLSQKFFDEINNDINLSLEFWKTFKSHHQRRTLDLNKVFYLTDNIRQTKRKIEKTWNSLFAIFSGVNDLFELYEDYVEQINDDDMLKRELDAIKNKMTNATDHILVNFYNLLFNKETGIIIANGDKSKEGIIERTNDEVEKIFDYKSDELKGMNVSFLMPKIFEKKHKAFMERYFDVGEKRRIDRPFKSFAKDRENSLIPVKLHLKLFPMLNDNIYFVSMVVRENLDDVILIDSKFNIQGISKKLMSKFELDNHNLFNDCDIPFYIICKKFINFYKTFLRTNKKNKKDKKKSDNNSNNNPATTTNLLIGEFSENQNSDAGLNKGKNIGIKVGDSDTNDPANLLFNLDGAGIVSNKSPGGDIIVDDDNILANLNENIEINENTELEYEITIPHFLQEYVSSINRRDNKMDLRLLKTNTLESNREDDKDLNNIQEDFDEEDNLVKETTQQPAGGGSSPVKNFNKQSDEEKEFQSKLKHYRTLFETGKYIDLLEILTKLNTENQTKEYKFNFTFDKHRFGDGHVAYVIRCIDNKVEYAGTESLSGENENDKDKLFRQLKSKVEALKDLNEVTAAEKVEIIERSEDYLRLCVESREFAKNLSQYKDEISVSSKVFGIKQEETNMEDENSSQSSQTSFNDNIAKKTRIEEIRSNVLQNVSNFHLLKWIKAIFYIIIIFTGAFCGLYLMIFDIIYNDLNNISELNIGLFQSTIWLSNSISSLISLRSLYTFNETQSNITFNSYLPNYEYFNTLQDFSTVWYYKIINIFGPVEYKTNLYFGGTNDVINFWTQKPITYPGNIINDTESFPLGLAQVLANMNQLIKDPNFDLLPLSKIILISQNQKNIIDFSAFMSIENAVDNLMPRQLKILSTAPENLMNQNKSNMLYVVIIMVSYSLLIILLVCVYYIILYLTNKSMEEGLEKVTKIKSEKIDETIKKIESFNEKCLAKYRQRDSKISQEDRDFKLESLNTKSSLVNDNNFSMIGEGKNYKSLTILSYSYFQIAQILLLLCAFLIPIYFISLQIIDSSNQILLIQNFIFGKCLTASASTVSIKCLISNCQLENTLNYNINYTQSADVETIVRDISNFPELSDFYSNKFLLNACAVIYNTTDPRYTTCMNDVYIKSANNTDSLLKLIDETVATIRKDRQMELNLPYKLQNGTVVNFTNPLLFETSYFKELEYIFYNYVTPISDSFSNVVSLSLTNCVMAQRVNIIILICVFAVLVLIFSFYVAFIFTKRLVHLLSVSRCILRIIPTVVINTTPELEAWIENKY